MFVTLISASIPPQHTPYFLIEKRALLVTPQARMPCAFAPLHCVLYRLRASA